MMPGTIPLMNRSPMETCAEMPYTTKGLLGGIMTPTQPAAATRAAEKYLSYTRSTIAGMVSAPMAATVAGPEPEIAPKNMQVTMAVRPIPP